MIILCPLKKDENILLIKERYERYFSSFNHQVIFAYNLSDLQIVSISDCLLLPGGNDVNPFLYHQINTFSHVKSYEDEIELAFLHAFLAEDKKIIGICRGIQLLNVALGGTLRQDIKNHGSCSHEIKMNSKTFTVNSFHHQCIDKLSPQLLSLALSEDKVIEIVRNKKILAFQFHPEMLESYQSNEYFRQLINEFLLE